MGSSRQLRPRSLFKSTRSLARSVSLAIGRTNKPTGKRYTHSVSSLCLISKCGLAKEPARRWLCRFWKQRQKCFVRWRPSIPPMFPAQFLTRSRQMNEAGLVTAARPQIDIFLAAGIFLTLKLVLVQSLWAANLLTAVRTSVIAHCLGRTAAVALLAGLPYVRAEYSKSSPFGNKVTLSQLAVVVVFSTILSLLVLGLEGVLCLAAAIAVTFLCGIYFKRQIGGITGDCLGAANQLVELSAYLSLVTLQKP